MYQVVLKKVLMSKKVRSRVLKATIWLASTKRGRKVLWRMRGLLPAPVRKKAMTKFASSAAKKVRH